MIQFIPAIDLYNEKVVRLHQGNYEEKTHYSHDPADLIRSYIDEGVQRLHIVDLNAARVKENEAADETNLALLEKIVFLAQKSNMKIQVGGGLRNSASIKRILDLGVHACILGTIAVRNFPVVKAALNEFGAERIIVGIDERQEQIQICGWESESGEESNSFVSKIAQEGVRTIIWTDISKDGTLAGPNWNRLEFLLTQHKNIHLILSGGIASLDDLKQTRLLKKKYPHFEGVISGKAIYEGRFSVIDAIATCQNT